MSSRPDRLKRPNHNSPLWRAAQSRGRAAGGWVHGTDAPDKNHSPDLNVLTLQTELWGLPGLWQGGKTGQTGYDSGWLATQCIFPIVSWPAASKIFASEMGRTDLGRKSENHGGFSSLHFCLFVGDGGLE